MSKDNQVGTNLPSRVAFRKTAPVILHGSKQIRRWVTFVPIKKSFTTTARQLEWLKAQIDSQQYGNESEVARALIREQIACDITIACRAGSRDRPERNGFRTPSDFDEIDGIDEFTHRLIKLSWRRVEIEDPHLVAAARMGR